MLLGAYGRHQTELTTVESVIFRRAFRLTRTLIQTKGNRYAFSPFRVLNTFQKGDGIDIKEVRKINGKVFFSSSND